jgi:sugar lactone lactonase YvrE
MLLKLSWRCLAERSLWAVFLGLAINAFGQVPRTINVVKYRTYQQISAANVQPTGASFAVQVLFTGAIPIGATLQVRGPSTSALTLARGANGSVFNGKAQFPDQAALDRAYPDGNYTVNVSGGSFDSSTPVTVITTPAFAPVLITNYDALQSWPDQYPRLRWDPIAGATGTDILQLTVSDADGRFTWSNGPYTNALGTDSAVYDIPFFQPLTADLMVFRFSSRNSANGGATDVNVGSGIHEQFQMQSVPKPPVILTQPLSAIGTPGTPIVLEIEVAGLNPTPSFVLRKDGVVVPDAKGAIFSGVSTFYRFTVPINGAEDAGEYSIEATNVAGAVTSAVARILVAPTMKVTTLFRATPGDTEGASVKAPYSVAVDSSGNVLIADPSANVIRKLTPQGVVTTFAGAVDQRGSADGVAVTARFNYPTGLAIDNAGNLFIADNQNFTIRKVSPTGAVSTVAGVTGRSGNQDGPANRALFNGPWDVAVDSAGNLYVSDVGNRTIRKISSAGMVSTLAGGAVIPSSFAGTDGIGAAAQFAGPRGLTVDAAGTVFVCDSNGGFRKVTADGQVATLVRGVATVFYDAVVDNTGALFVLSYSALYRCTLSGALTLEAGRAGIAGYADGIGSAALFWAAGGIAVDAQRRFYIADTTNAAIRQAVLIGGSTDPHIAIISSPKSQVVAPGTTTAFSVTATGPELSYQWQKNGVPIQNGVFSTLVIFNPTVADVASYRVLISNAVGAVVTPPADLAFTSTKDVGRITNLSVRSPAGVGTQTMIVGLSLKGGSAGVTKPILIRAVGPGLTPFGITTALPDPQLEVISGTQMIATNDDWGGASQLVDAFTSVGAFGFSRDSHDAALVGQLSAGPYSVRILGKEGSTGTALAELYDLAPGVENLGNRPHLANVSARAQAGSGAAALVAGFVITGSSAKTVMIRGIGPSLEQFGVTGVLSNPRLDVFSQGMLVASNDDWGGMPDAWFLFRQVGAFNLAGGFSKDSVAIITLPPGAYAAQVSSVTGETGVGLIEIYEVP